MNRLQILLNECLIETKHVESAAVLVLKSGTVAAESANFKNHSQVQTLIDCFKHTAATRENGLHFQDTVYSCVRADGNSVYSKSNGRGLILVKTAIYVVAATYNEDMYPAVCVEAVETFAEYLRKKGK